MYYLFNYLFLRVHCFGCLEKKTHWQSSIENVFICKFIDIMQYSVVFTLSKYINI